MASAPTISSHGSCQHQHDPRPVRAPLPGRDGPLCHLDANYRHPLLTTRRRSLVRVLMAVARMGCCTYLPICCTAVAASSGFARVGHRTRTLILARLSARPDEGRPRPMPSRPLACPRRTACDVSGPAVCPLHPYKAGRGSAGLGGDPEAFTSGPTDALPIPGPDAATDA